MRHPNIRILLSFFKDNSDNDDETMDVFKEASENCKMCNSQASFIQS